MGLERSFWWFSEAKKTSSNEVFFSRFDRCEFTLACASKTYIFRHTWFERVRCCTCWFLLGSRSQRL